MNPDDWRPEMQHLLEVFERESTLSLRKIKQCFVASHRPFDDQFRQYYLKLSIIRLNTGFNTILFEEYFDEAAVQMPPNLNGATDGEKMSSNDEFPISPKIENITDSNDENVAEKQHVDVTDGPIGLQGRSKPLLQPNDDDANCDVGLSGADFLSNQIDIAFNVKREIKNETGTEAEMEMVDLPVVEFDPVKENERSSKGNCVSVTELVVGEKRQAGPSSSVQKREKRGASNIFKCKDCTYTSQRIDHLERHQQTHDPSAAKPFKCEYCDYASRFKFGLDRHQQIHADQKLIGAARDPTDGLYKCTHCTQGFVNLRALSLHWSKSHQNNQRLFNCGHCMRRFTQKTEKDRHESRCRSHRYECYLCKIYGSRYLSHMQRHMRTHSGAMPYQCAICNRFFRKKDTLKYHLNAIHKCISK